MNNLLFNLLYLIDVSIEVLLIKALSLYFGINNYIFLGFVFSWCLPLFLFKIIRNYKNPEWYDLANGLLDYVILQLVAISVAELSIGEYISYRTSTTFFTALILYFIDKKILPINKYIGLVIILISCIVLIIYSGVSSILSTFLCLFMSVLYSITNIIIEKKLKTEEHKKLNYYWTKTISSIISLTIGLNTQINYNLISNIFRNFNHTNLIYILIICFSISITENLYCYLKIKIISNYESDNSSNNGYNGSMIINFLDIIRRFIMIFVSIFLFNENYENYLYVCFFIIIIGVIINLIDINKIRNYLINKFYGRINDTNNIEITIV